MTNYLALSSWVPRSLEPELCPSNRKLEDMLWEIWPRKKKHRDTGGNLKESAQPMISNLATQWAALENMDANLGLCQQKSENSICLWVGSGEYRRKEYEGIF